ncbi:MAG: hypothetical protein LUC34_07710 [Campylobacter sp.]|nr:hypothetical protein [Campylobacter sp.]
MKFFTFLVLAVFGFAADIEIIHDEAYHKKICGDDYSCVDQKYLYKNTTLPAAYSRYFQDYALHTKGNKSTIYKKAMSKNNLPSVGKTKKLEYKLDPNMDNICKFEFKRISRDVLTVEYNTCSFEMDLEIKLTQIGNDVEVVLSGDNGL